MPSANITALTNYGGAQGPADLAYIAKSPFGATDDRKSTLNDLFAIITKNISDISLGFQDGAATATVSAAGQGKIRYNDTTKTFQFSVDGGAYSSLIVLPVADTQTIIKGSADPTKLLRFEIDGFTAGATRVLTPPDADIVIAGSAAALIATRIPFAITGGLLLDSANFTFDSGNNRLQLGIASSATGQLRFAVSGDANVTTFQAGDAPASDVLYKWPADDPAAAEVLAVTSFSGGTATLEWATVTVPVGANPTASVGLTIVNGVAATFMRSDAAPALSQAIAPTWTGQHIWQVSNAAAVSIGPNGDTNPTLRIVTNTASGATGLSITNAAAGSGVTLTALSSGSDEALVLRGKGAAGINLQSSAGANILQINRAGTGRAEFVTNTVADISGSDAWSFQAGNMVNGSGLQLKWMSGAQWYTGSTDTGLARAAAGVLRATNASTGAGSLIIGTSAGAIGTSGAGVLAFALSTAPSTSPTDTVQLYSADSAAGDHNLLARNEAGGIARLTGTIARNSAQFDKTDTTLADITGLSLNVEAGKTYSFFAMLFTTSDVAGGVKAAIGGTATATAIIYEGLTTNVGSITQSRATALGSAVGAVTAVTAAIIQIWGTITVNAAGTLTVQFAENAATATSSVLVGSYLQLVQE